MALPIPAIFTAFSIDECASAEQYAVMVPASVDPVSLMANDDARSRPARIAQRVAVLAVSWIDPTKPSGRPTIWRSHSSTRSSNSAAAGDVSHIMHWGARVTVSISASTEGRLLLAWKAGVLPVGHAGDHNRPKIGEDILHRLRCPGRRLR